MKYLKRFENPNKIQYDNKNVRWNSAETYVFSYYGSNELFIVKGMTHADLLVDIHDKGKISTDTFNKYEGDFQDYYYRGECSGRLFVSENGTPVNIISFWRFPKDNEEMKKLAQDIKEKTGIDIWSDNWKVEIINDSDLESTKDQSVWVTTDVDFIPVKEYKKSKERDEEEIKIPHLMNWEEKQSLKKKTGWGRGWGSDMTAWDSKNPLQWRQAKYQESMTPRLNEDPDNIEYKGELLVYQSDDAIPFAYDVSSESVLIGENGTTHNSNNISNYECTGRLWLENKVMSFWVYPEAEIFKIIINSLEDVLGKKLWNNGWYVEILMKDDKKPYIGDIWYIDDSIKIIKPTFIPIEEYVGSENVPEEQKAIHMMNWEEKQALKKKIGWGKGWGSDMTTWDSKNPLQWRQSKYQESYKMKYLKRFEFLNWLE